MVKMSLIANALSGTQWTPSQLFLIPSPANAPPFKFCIWVILNMEGISTTLKVPALILRAVLLTALIFLIAPGIYPQTTSSPPDDVAAQALKFAALYNAIEE